MSNSIDFRTFPKVSLHDHLDGGLRAETLLELAESIGHQLPADSPDALRAWFIAAASSGSLVQYLETFEHTVAVMQTAESLARVAQEFVEDLADDGVIYGEVRWAPEQHLQSGLSLDESVEAVQAGIERGMALTRASGRDIEVRQILTAMRHAECAQEIAELAVRHRDVGVVGFDIAGAEDGFPPSRFTEAFRCLAEQNFPVTIHAGEAAGLASIQSALVDGRALRLGHGVRIMENLQRDGAAVRCGLLAEWIRDRGIALEVCVSSNLQTGAVAAWAEEAAQHPFDTLYRSGFCVTVNTDNRLVSGVTLSSEFALLAETFNYGPGDFLALSINAAKTAFLPLPARRKLIAQLEEAYGS